MLIIDDAQQLNHELIEPIIKFSSYNPNAAISIAGYTDSLGDYGYNRNFSKLRADVVKNYLVAHGIPASRIETIGMGSQNPIKSNETLEGRKQNRRVEVKLKMK